MTIRPRQLVLYTRPGCYLCTDAGPRVRRAARWAGLTLREVNIDHEPELAVDYGMRIPVVEDSAGTVLAEGEITTWGLWKTILKTRRVAAGR